MATTNELPTRVQIRLLSMSTEELHNYVKHAGNYDYTAEDEARTARHLGWVKAELASREAAGGGR